MSRILATAALATPALAKARTSWVLAGRTERVTIRFDSVLGDNGLTVAAGVLERAERDIDVIGGWFGGPAPAGRIRVFLAHQDGMTRARRKGRRLHVDLQTVPRLNQWYSSFLTAGLLVDLFASQGRPARTGHLRAALVRTLAAACYPAQLIGFDTAAAWLDGSRPDVLHAPAKAVDPAAVGGATLFLNWLHHQLGYSWRDIVRAEGTTLAAIHAGLTGSNDDPYPVLRQLLDDHFPADRLCQLLNDNPFPLAPEAPEHEPLYQFALVGPGAEEPAAIAGSGPAPALAARPAAEAPAASSSAATTPAADPPETDLDAADPPGGPADTGGPPGTWSPALTEVLQNRRWLWATSPFAHVRAYSVFTPGVYEAMVEQFRTMWQTERFARDIPGYDVDATAITSDNAGAFSVFTSQAWHDLWSSLFGVRGTGDLNVALHHHQVGSTSGRPHNDLNPGWFVQENRPDGISVHDPAVCDYKTGESRSGAPTYERIRAVALLFYLANEEHRSWHGGGTGLYRRAGDPVTAPAAMAEPVNNSLMAFECTPSSFHSFMTNPYVERNCLVMWIHQTEEDVLAKWGEERIVRW